MQIILTITQQDVDEFNAQYFIEHPKAKKPPIKGPFHPSLNEYVIANNMKGNAMKQQWKSFILFLLDRKGLRGQEIEQCEVIYRTYFKTKRLHDVDNITPKYIFDGLVEGGFIVADDYRHITGLYITCGYDPINPRIELIFNYGEKEK